MKKTTINNTNYINYINKYNRGVSFVDLHLTNDIQKKVYSETV